MAAATFHNSVGPVQLHGYSNDPVSLKKFRNSSLQIISKGVVDAKLQNKGVYNSSCCKVNCVRASSCHASVVDHVLAVSHSTSNCNRAASIESSLILIRHGESMWNEKNLFTGCVDVPLTKRGIDEAIEAGRRISNIPVDMIFTSMLIRAQMTAMLAMTQHRRQKARSFRGKRIIYHEEDELRENDSEFLQSGALQYQIRDRSSKEQGFF